MAGSDVDYWLINVLGFGGALLLSRLVASRTGSWLTYAHLFSLFWGANILASQLVLDGLLRPDTRTLLVLFAAWWLLLAGSLLILRPLDAPREAGTLLRWRALFLLFSLIALQGLAVAVELAAINQTPLSFFRDFVDNAIALRWDVDSTSRYFVSWSLWRWDQILYIPLALLLHSKSMIPGRLLTAIYVWAVLLASARFTRLPLIGLAVISFVAWIILYNPAKRARLAIGTGLAILGLGLFFATQTTLVERHVWWKVTPSESLVAYIGSSPLAYETLLTGNYSKVPGVLYSLEPANYLLFKLSIIDSYPGLTRPPAAIPFTTNVYTFLDAFTLDWGIPGALAGAFLIGGLVALAFNRLTLRVTYTTLTVYCYLSFCCVMAIATNEFIRVALFVNLLLAAAIGWVIRGDASQEGLPHDLTRLQPRRTDALT